MHRIALLHLQISIGSGALMAASEALVESRPLVNAQSCLTEHRPERPAAAQHHSATRRLLQDPEARAPLLIQQLLANTFTGAAAAAAAALARHAGRAHEIYLFVDGISEMRLAVAVFACWQFKPRKVCHSPPLRKINNN
jgi:hypothetical protein